MSDDPKKPLLATGDLALIKAAATGEGAIPLTQEMLDSFAEAIKERERELKEDYPKLVEACPYDMRLAVTAWVFDHLVKHAKEGGSFRYLIYDRLGFKQDAYAPLYMSGGMVISNEFDLSKDPEA
jgi:hypothetical protein